MTATNHNRSNWNHREQFYWKMDKHLVQLWIKYWWLLWSNIWCSYNQTLDIVIIGCYGANISGYYGANIGCHGPNIGGCYGPNIGCYGTTIGFI